jgi:hypothetical protein
MAESARANGRMIWLLARMTTAGRHRDGAGFLVAWDTDTVDEFVRAFPEAAATLRVYMVGPNSSPMLNRAAKRAERRGFVVAGRVGNQDARAYNQRTWCRTWTITDEGRAFLATRRA